MSRSHILSVLIASFLVGCGSSSSTAYIGRGVYIDSPVSGVNYKCGVESGVTSSSGEFYYELGKECLFSIGDFSFRKVKPELLKKPKAKIYEDSLNIARLLQTLDLDGDTSNGIQISADEGEFLNKLKGLEDSDVKSLHKTLKSNISDYRGKYVELSEAEDHINSVKNGIPDLIPVIKLSASTVRQNESVTFNADESRGDIESYEWSSNGKVLGGGSTLTIMATRLTLGRNTITLKVKDKHNQTKIKTALLIVKAPPSPWDSATVVSTKGDNKLLARSDKNNIYIKYQAPDSINSATIIDTKIYINSDDSEISGLQTGAIGDGYDYVADFDRGGLFHLAGKDDYVGTKVQDLDVSVKNSSVEFAIDRKNIEYLAKNITLSAYRYSDKFAMKGTPYTIPNYTAPEDKVAPIIVVDDKLITIKKGDALVLPQATAFDVGDNANISVSVDKSKVNTSKEGYYTIYYTATDSKGNKSTAGVNVRVTGSASANTLEKKDLGALKESVMINHQNGQVWANDDTTSYNGESTRGCFVIGEGAVDVAKNFKRFCDESNYAGFHDWRVPAPIELSKFTIKLEQEKKSGELGMARKHCIRTLGIEDDNTTIKAVYTHVQRETYKKAHLVGQINSSPLTPAGGRCVRGPKDNSTGKLEIKELSGGRVIEDSTTATKKLMWVNEYNPDKKACLAIHYTQPKEYDASKTFCQNLTYAGFSDWRDPTSTELSSFVKETNRVHIMPGYEAPCKKLLARDKDGNKRVDKEVYTSFSSLTPGTIKDANLTKSNIGLRCVRDVK